MAAQECVIAPTLEDIKKAIADMPAMAFCLTRHRILTRRFPVTPLLLLRQLAQVFENEFPFGDQHIAQQTQQDTV